MITDGFRTTFAIDPPGFGIDYDSRVLMAGSCFAKNIAARMRDARFRVVSNPTGVVYNPLSVANMLRSVHGGLRMREEDLVREPGGEAWSSFLFHGSFSDRDRAAACARMNAALDGAEKGLKEAEYVIITFGTAWVYELAGGGGAVSNCHRFPASHFVRRRLGVGEIVEEFGGLMDGALAGKRVIFTVSPVRHLKDGAAGNSLSKAALRLAAAELEERYGNVSYFPAYEIMNDDLRDYRFYADDMVHPSAVAVDYIWELFCGWAMTERARRFAAGMEKVGAAMRHRPFDTGGAAYAEFKRSMLARVEALASEYPGVDFGPEKEYFGKR